MASFGFISTLLVHNEDVRIAAFRRILSALAYISCFLLNQEILRSRHNPSLQQDGHLPSQNRRSLLVAEHSAPESPPPAAEGIRINKALRASHSRRQTDDLVSRGLVTINGRIADHGMRILPGDKVRLHGRVVDWERLNTAAAAASQTPSETTTPARQKPTDNSPFVYIKYWKPKGVICTTDLRQPQNILAALGPLPHTTDRVFPVGRLDAASTGLILLTSDGTIVNSLLRFSAAKSKTYAVTTARRASNAEIARLAAGVVITTVAQRDGNAKALTARTRPCGVRRGRGERELVMELKEGRNRQIRRMCATFEGLEVVALHRTGFAGVGLEGLKKPGDWKELSEKEMEIIGAFSIRNGG